MLNNNKYIDQIKEKFRFNKSNKIFHEYNFNKHTDMSLIKYKHHPSDEEETIKTNDTNEQLDVIYNTNNVIINHNKYPLNCDIKKYLPHVIEFNNKQNIYSNIYNTKISNDSFFNLAYDDNITHHNAYIVLYYINMDIIPFIMFFMIKDNTNQLYTFPEFNMNTNINKLDPFKENYSKDIQKYIKDVYNYDSTIKGIKNYNNSSYIFTEIKKIERTNSLNKGIWSLPHELINDKQILNVKVNDIINDFIINHIDFFTLINNYEQPIVAYQLIPNDSDLVIFYTLDNFKKIVPNELNQNEGFHRVALFIGKLKINLINDRNRFSDCNSISKYDKYRQLSMLLIHSNKQIVYLSTHKLNELL
jgi:hypothetical protein